MVMPGRKFSAGNGYRYGFNGKENDDEVKGEDSQQDYGMRIYDPRVGKFLSVDPLTKKYPELTPYQFASNIPISGVDLDGLEFYFAADGAFLGKSEKGGTQIRVATKYHTANYMQNGKQVSMNVVTEYKDINKVSVGIASNVYAKIYQMEVGQPSVSSVVASDRPSTSTASTNPITKEVTVYYQKTMHSDDGTRPILMTDYYNASTTLNHEKDHAAGLSSNGFDHFKIGMRETTYKHFSMVTKYYIENLKSNLRSYLGDQENSILKFREKGDNVSADHYTKEFKQNILKYNKKFNENYKPIVLDINGQDKKPK
jgi:RHS repeat-associated protein